MIQRERGHGHFDNGPREHLVQLDLFSFHGGVPIARLAHLSRTGASSPFGDGTLLVGSIARRIAAPPPTHILVGLDPNFFVTQMPVVCQGQTFAGRTLFLSLPVCRVMSEDELANIVAHELAHFKGRDTEFGERIAPIYRGLTHSVAVLAHGLDRGGVSSWPLRPAFLTFTVFLETFSVAESAISRDRELEADAVAASAAGATVAATALVKVHAVEAAWEKVSTEAIEEVRHGRLMKNVSARFVDETMADREDRSVGTACRDGVERTDGMGAARARHSGVGGSARSRCAVSVASRARL